MSHIEAELTPDQIEHIAVRAAERENRATEAICNLALSGNAECADIVRDIIANEPTYAEWLELGRNTGYRSRS